MMQREEERKDREAELIAAFQVTFMYSLISFYYIIIRGFPVLPDKVEHITILGARITSVHSHIVSEINFKMNLAM